MAILDVSPSSAIQPFAYAVQSVAMSGNGSDTQTLVLGIDASFNLYGIEAASSLDSASNTQYPDNFSVLITDTTSGRQWSNIPLVRSVIASNVFNFTPEGRSIVFPVGNQFRFDFTNLSGSTNTVTLALKGYKIFTR